MLFLSFLIIFACADTDSSLKPKDDGIITVGIYVDDGAYQDSYVAAKKMFEWMEYETKLIDATIINLGEIETIDIFYFPAGILDKYIEDISNEGRLNLKTMIYAGSSFIGTGAGAIYACRRYIWGGGFIDSGLLSLVNGDGVDRSLSAVSSIEYFMSQVIYEKPHPITEFTKSYDWMLYYNSPHFEPYDNVTHDVVGRYNLNGEIALIALEYGEGRVFLTGPQPELEEDSERDDVDYYDDLNDQGSEWDMMKNAVNWCLQQK